MSTEKDKKLIALYLGVAAKAMRLATSSMRKVQEIQSKRPELKIVHGEKDD